MKPLSLADTFFQKIAAPLNSLLHKTGFPLLLGLFTAFTIFLKLQTDASDSIVGAMLDFVSLTLDSTSVAKLILVLISTFCWHFLLTATPLVSMNPEGLSAAAVIVMFLLALGAFIQNSNPILLAILLFWCAVLGLYKAIRGNALDYGLMGNLGTAQFLDDFASLFKLGLIQKEEGFILGKVLDSRASKTDFLRADGEFNGITFAKSGGGKGIGTVIPNLLTYLGSMIVLDIKGENFLKSVAQRTKMGHQIYLIDPFGEVAHQIQGKLLKLNQAIPEDKNNEVELKKAKTFYEDLLLKVSLDGEYLKGINPMEVILQLIGSENYDAVFDESGVLANAIVIRSGNEKDQHFDLKAISMLRCSILLLAFCDLFEDRPKNLLSVRELILDIFQNKKLLDSTVMACHDEKGRFYRYLKHIPAEFLLIGSEERNSVISTFQRHTDFIESPYVSTSLAREDGKIGDIKHVSKTIYLVLPVNKLEAYSRLMRLWLDTIFQSVGKNLEIPQKRVIFLLDEVAQLGNMPSISRAVSLMRGYGVNLWFIFQDIPQLKSTYGEKWQTFIANSKIQQYFNITDSETAKYLSEQLGPTTITVESVSSSDAEENKGLFGKKSKTYSSAARALMHPDEIRRFPHQIIIYDKAYPIRAQKTAYYEDSYFTQPFNLPIQYKDV